MKTRKPKLSASSPNNNAIDIKEQTCAMVDAGARVQAELIVEQSGLQSLRQIYGDGNVRVRESQARIASLQAQLDKMTGAPGADGSSSAMTNPDAAEAKPELYPPLRQLPRLAVPYADLHRCVQVQPAALQLLTQQYETARIEEAKDIPAVSVIDGPGIGKKSLSRRVCGSRFWSHFSPAQSLRRSSSRAITGFPCVHRSAPRAGRRSIPVFRGASFPRLPSCEARHEEAFH